MFPSVRCLSDHTVDFDFRKERRSQPLIINADGLRLHQTLRGLARYAEFLRDLFLVVAGNIVEPAGTRRIVQSATAGILPSAQKGPPWCGKELPTEAVLR